MRSGTPSTTVILRSAGIALLVGLTIAYALSPGSASGLGRSIELAAVIVLGMIVMTAVVAGVTAWLGGWQHQHVDFELQVQRSEQLAARGLAVAPDEGDFLTLDPLRDDDFEELVRDALDELPDLLQNALAHVAVVISDGGRRAHAYGLYQGDGVHRDDHPDRIVIFRDTLRRDFGHDPDLLHEQVVRVVRHELAHHVGFDEMGVGELGL